MRTAKSRVIIRHIFALSTLFLLGLAASGYWYWTKAESATTTDGLPTLRGEAALTRLKERGLYASLGEAVKAARYNAQPLPPDVVPLLAGSLRLEAGDGAAEDYFGAAVAISGNTAIVGAPRNDINGDADQGAAYIFVRSGRSWTQEDKLKAPTGAAGDFFGGSVVISGDTAIVGAYLNDIEGIDFANQGSVYIFTRSAGVWTQQDKLTASDGAAVVFVRSGSTWTKQQKLTAAYGAEDDYFGGSVAICGDTVIVGAPENDIGGNEDQGSANIFIRSGATWTHQQRLAADDGATRDYFGNSVAISGDTVLVGAIFADPGGNSAQGAAYVFTRSGATWMQQQKLTASDGALGDTFSEVAISGDTAVVGAPLHDIGGNTHQGAAYVFVRSGATWTQQQKLIASDGAGVDFFASSVAISGDTVVVGAPYADVGANEEQGSVYVFAGVGCPAITLDPPLLPNGAAGSPYNWSITATGGSGIYNYSVSSGTLPAGLTLNPTTGALSGAPTASGAFNFAVRATDSGGCSGVTAYVLTVNCPTIQINPANPNLPNGTAGAPFNGAFTVMGGTAPYSFSITIRHLDQV
ncbi:MAG: putative Ig domain-containing protein [Blastocatellia bacterium]